MDNSEGKVSHRCCDLSCPKNLSEKLSKSFLICVHLCESVVQNPWCLGVLVVAFQIGSKRSLERIMA